MTFPTFSFEKELWSQNYHVIGVDEVGRGCLAGPAYVSAFYFPPLSTQEIERLENMGINDSKKLLPQKRKIIHDLLLQENILYETGSATVDQINTFGIAKAIQDVAYKTVEKLSQKVAQDKIFILSDGSLLQNNTHCKVITKGDSISISIAAASIMAKVTRDVYMEQLSEDFPYYFWQENKGYGTKTHRDAVKAYGKTPHHRELFLRKILSH